MVATTMLLSQEQCEKIRQYKYAGEDRSFMYKLALSPLAQFCVDNFIPLWMAPNVVTLLGLLATVLAALITYIINPSLGPDSPRYLSVLSGIAIFVYQTFDNMDGKQARRTGSSSALGQLFDHGCDAVNACVIPICFGSVIASGWTVSIFLCLWSGFVPFYFQTWEEYYTGNLILPVFNGPSEGLLMAVTICFISAIYGPNWWHTPITTSWNVISSYPHDLTPFHVIFSFVVVCGTITLIAQVITTCIACAKKGKSVSEALIALLPFLVFFPSLFFWLLLSKVAFQRVPLLSLLLASSIFVEMVTHLIVMHITKSPLRPFQRFMVLFTVVLLGNILWNPSGSSPLNEELLIRIFATFSFVFTATKTFLIYTDVANALNIYVFSLNKKRTN